MRRRCMGGLGLLLALAGCGSGVPPEKALELPDRARELSRQVDGIRAREDSALGVREAPREAALDSLLEE